MRLIELSANKSSFKRVKFNRTGLSLVVGHHTKNTARNLQSTYNGVGKSLIVALVNYCLGSNRNEHFDTHLEDWAFTLTFEHAGQNHQIVRATNENVLRFDEEELSLNKFKERLTSLRIFEMPAEGIPFLTFSSLIGFFLRPRRSSYVSFARPQRKWTDYQNILCQSFLLGLDYQRVVQKHDLKDSLDKRMELANRYKKDKELRDYYVGEKNAEVEVTSLTAQIERLEKNIRQFQVAEDYAQRQAAADATQRSLAEKANEQIVLENLIADIDLALRVRADVPPEHVVQLYKEAEVHLPQVVTKQLEEVQEFHRRLYANRRTRLEKEKQDAEHQLAALHAQGRTLQAQLDRDLQYLHAHQALDVYTKNNRYLAELIARRQRIQDYLQLMAKYTEEAQKIKVEMGQATVATSQYINNSRPHLDLLMGRFREYAQELYGTVPAGLVVRNNDGENQVRYDIEAHIEHDAADGINEGKIFCYDLLLLTLQQRHALEFLFHDSRLFADMDKHQRFSLFRLAERVCRLLDVQYIATLNEDIVDSVRELAGNDFQRLFDDPCILELTDTPGGSGKLLGVQIDMKYDDE